MSEATRTTVRTLSRATVASGLATVTEIGLLWVLVHPVHMPRWVAFWVVQFYCNALTFLLYKYWAFDAAKLGRARTQYMKQLVIFGGSMLLNTAIPSLLTYKLHVEAVIAFIASQVVVYLGWNYPGNRYWVFRNAATATAAPAATTAPATSPASPSAAPPPPHRS